MAECNSSMSIEHDATDVGTIAQSEEVCAEQGNVDGAFFGTTFPHLLLMTYPGMRPQQPLERYVPRVFGFKLNAAALAPPPAGDLQQRNERNEAAGALGSRVGDDHTS